MKLVEVIRALTTSEETAQALTSFATSLGKEPIAAPDRPGFIVNRLLVPFLLDAIREYETVAPYWMAALVNKGLGENAITPLYDVTGIFQAKALILREPATELEKVLDVPGFARGDMFYLLNLVSVLDAYAGNAVTRDR